MSGFLIDLAVILTLLAAFRQFRTPRGAKSGNLAAALALMAALLLVLWRNALVSPGIAAAAGLAGASAGYIIAMRVSMIRIPAMVAFQHGGGGVAAFLISFVELSHRPAGVTGLGEISGLIGLTVGAATFSASLIAGGKLANKIRQTPRILPAHGVLLTVNILAILVTGVLGVGWGDTGIRYDLLFLILLSVSLGIVFSMRIGGADMPVLISFLNATAGLAAAFCGIAIENRLLIACGATVAASGSILTHVMCKAMNRSVLKVFLLSAIRFPSPAAAPPVREASCAPPAVDMPPSSDADPGGNVDRVLAALKSAKKVVMVPGYGMAIAQAQFEVVALAKKLIGMGRT